MKIRSMNLFFGIFLRISLVILPSCCRCQQIRRLSTLQTNSSVQYGFANMVAHVNHILDVTPIQVITSNITSNSNCIVHCINFDTCTSTNVVVQNALASAGHLECQLLGTDRFRNSTSFVEQIGSTHYAISHDCEWEETCINPNHKCIPHYDNETYECLCPFQTYDEHCMNELTENMAIHKPVLMAKTYGSNYGSHCTDGEFGPGSSFCTTGASKNEWIQIDLGSRKIITFLILHNRHTEDLNLLRRLSQTDINVFDSPGNNQRFCTHIGDTVTLVYFAQCTKPLLARYVKLSQLDIGSRRYMSLAEIMVY
ncbi:uncharacterized protein [Clytia hemisphaerica]|uniref:EGF-like domain-containing protein n=1 Tax=Clytia hemisphaerica TaxID=252671 RepID=A0A7M5V925_9CNID